MAAPDSQHTISRSSILYGSQKEDVWYDLDQFYNDHIQEIYHRISSLDDEIWGKIILMEKNKRVAKAYLRIPMVLIDGTCNGFNGQRIGFCSFENPTRDRSVEEIRNKIGSGIILKMDQKGNLLAKRVGATPVIVQGADRPELFCFGNDLTKVKGRLEVNQPVKVFDMKLFRNSIEQELQKPYPDRKRLMFQTLLRISLVKDEQHPFKTPCWFTIINLVALDMLVNKVPTMPTNLPDPLMFSARQNETLTDMQREQLINQSNCDLYGTLTPMTQFVNKQMINYAGHWSEVSKSSSSEYIDQMNRNQTQRQQQKIWKAPVVGGYMSEAEGTKMLHRRNRSSEPRMRPVTQCWSTVPSVENLHLYATIDNLGNGINFGSHNGTPAPVGSKKMFPSSNNVAYYGPVKNNGWICAGSSSDYESSRMEIYESSNSSSNSGLSGSCRPSSPSIVSEASESQTSDSGFADTDGIRSSTRVASPSSSGQESDTIKEKLNVSSTSLESVKKFHQPCHRSLSKTSELTVIDTKIELVEEKESVKEKQSKLNLIINDQCTKLETKPTVVNGGDIPNHPIPPARRRHQSIKDEEINFLPLSLAPTLLASDDDDTDTKIYSF